MLALFKQFSEKRSAWFLLACSSLALELTALYFQYGMGQQPCVLCVYERLAVAGLYIEGIIAIYAPRALFSVRHLDLQMNPAPWKQCEVVPDFPEMMPLHKWLPSIFGPTGSCNDSQWSLFGNSMVQWLVFIFAVYVVVLTLMFIAQIKKSQKQRRLFH